jgi:hypothetical protein
MSEGKMGLPPVSSPEAKKELTVENAAKLLFFSFRFSQGYPALQEYIIQWLSARFPDYRIDSIFKEVEDKLIEMIRKFSLKTPSVHQKEVHTSEGRKKVSDPNVLDNEVGNVMNWAKVYFAPQIDGNTNIYGVERHGIKVLLAQITSAIIERDYLFLVEDGGRGRPREKGKFESHFISYVLNQKPTGCAEYDQMFKEAGVFIKQEENMPPSQRAFSAQTFEKLEKIKNIHKED